MSSQVKPSTEASSPPRRRRRYVLSILGAALAAAIAIWTMAHPSSDPTQQPLPEWGTAPAVPDGPPWFRDMTAASGVDFTYRNGEESNQFAILESLGGGVGLIDFDGDGLLDLFFTGGGYFDGQEIKGYPCRLYKNLGNWKFVDVTAAVGLSK